MNRKGFTLIELVVVILIISILATIGGMTYHKYLQSARDVAEIMETSNTEKKEAIDQM